MGSLLQKLENNEAILLMFLADELPAEDRAEVEQLLSTDANLRAQLEALQSTDEALRADVQAELSAGPMRLREAALVRDAGRLIRQWQVDRAKSAAAEAASAPVEAAPRSRWWLYPMAAAAIVAVVFIAFWGGPGEVPGGGPTEQVPDQAIAERLQTIEEENLTARAERLEHLDDAEQQVAALDALTSSNAVLFENLNEQNR